MSAELVAYAVAGDAERLGTLAALVAADPELACAVMVAGADSLALAARRLARQEEG